MHSDAPIENNHIYLVRKDPKKTVKFPINIFNITYNREIIKILDKGFYIITAFAIILKFSAFPQIHLFAKVCSTMKSRSAVFQHLTFKHENQMS